MSDTKHPWRDALEGTILKMGSRIEELEREVTRLRAELVMASNALDRAVDFIDNDIERGATRYAEINASRATMKGSP